MNADEIRKSFAFRLGTVGDVEFVTAEILVEMTAQLAEGNEQLAGLNKNLVSGLSSLATTIVRYGEFFLERPNKP